MVSGEGNDSAANPRLLIVARIHDVASTLRDRVESAVHPHGLTYDQWRVVKTLAESGPQSMRILGESTRITGPTLTRVVDRLAQDALVFRDVDGMDRRRVLVHLAERGHNLYSAVHWDVAEVEAAVFAPLSAEESGLLGALLARVSPTASEIARQGAVSGA